MKNCCSGVKPSIVGAGGLPLERLQERAVGDPRAGEVADRLAQHQLAVVVDARLDEVAVELVHHALPSLLELLQVGLGPPVLEAALRVVLRALVVEAVADLVADDDADRAVVHRVGRVHG